MKFTHNAIEAKDISKTIEFYEDFCELRIVKDRRDLITRSPQFEGATRRVVWMAPKAEASPLFVIIEETTRDEKTDSFVRHFGFEVETREKVDFLYKKALNKSYKVVEPRDMGDFLGYLFLVKDPDGRFVEFTAGQKVEPEGWDI